MKRLLFLLFLVASVSVAHAQQKLVMTNCNAAALSGAVGSVVGGTVDQRGNACVVIAPLAFANQGTMSVGQSSTTVSSANVTMTAGTFPASSTALPTGLIRIKNQVSSSGNLSVCPYGASGGCSASNGELLAPGESRVFALPNFASTPALVYCVSGTCAIEVEE